MNENKFNLIFESIARAHNNCYDDIKKIKEVADDAFRKFPDFDACVRHVFPPTKEDRLFYGALYFSKLVNEWFTEYFGDRRK